MARPKLTTEEFIRRSIESHNGRYSYNKTEYKGSFTKVLITCDKHGDFLQDPSNHLRGISGCKMCYKDDLRIAKKSNKIDSKIKELNQPIDFKLIPLSKGKFAKVDNEYFDRLMKYLWFYNHHKGYGYATNAELGKMHRYLMGYPKGKVVDHINGEYLDNRKSNLRVCSQQENSFNQRVQNGFKGVYFRKDYEKWQSYITINGNRKHLGYFSTPQEAAIAYNLAAIKYFKEFARLNKIS